MSRLVVKLLLSIAAFPLALVAWFLGEFAVVIVLRSWIGSHYIAMIVLPWSLMVLVFQGLWFAIWRSSIKWTNFRRVGTLVIAVASVALPIIVATDAMAGSSLPGDIVFFGLFVYLASIPFQLSLLWRSTKREEAHRLAEWRTVPTLRCPYCQGVLAGRTDACCSHCGGDLVGQPLAGVTQ